MRGFFLCDRWDALRQKTGESVPREVAQHGIVSASVAVRWFRYCCFWCLAVLVCSVGGVAPRFDDGLVTFVVVPLVGCLLCPRLGDVRSLASTFIVHQRSSLFVGIRPCPSYRLRADVACSCFSSARSSLAILVLVFSQFVGFGGFALVLVTKVGAARVFVLLISRFQRFLSADTGLLAHLSSPVSCLVGFCLLFFTARNSTRSFFSVSAWFSCSVLKLLPFVVFMFLTEFSLAV